MKSEREKGRVRWPLTMITLQFNYGEAAYEGRDRLKIGGKKHIGIAL